MLHGQVHHQVNGGVIVNHLNKVVLVVVALVALFMLLDSVGVVGGGPILRFN